MVWWVRFSGVELGVGIHSFRSFRLPSAHSLHSLIPTVGWQVVIGAALRAAPITMPEAVFVLKSLSQYYHLNTFY